MRKSLHTFIDLLFDKSLYVSGIAVLLLSVIDISNVNEWTVSVFGISQFKIGKLFYYLIVLIAFIFGIVSVAHAKNVSDLENDKKEKGEKIRDLESTLSEIVQETNELFNSYIKLLVKNLDFTHSERISVYKVYQNSFVLIGRSSINPNLMEKGRPKYPLKQGFIGKGWAEGEYFVDDLPDPLNRSGDTYFKKVNEISPIEREVVDNLNMKSRTYFVYRVNGFDNNPKAVLVFESEKEKAFAKENIIESLAGVKQPLIMFIEKNNGVKALENKDLDL
ncbi:hypothetical protein [Botryobacter ruber]|uniref:hypothetical protein n=1 Tax=Botryobacter ruber TaxID=2171629 RepID=UPI000F64A846|nr:hypothetical protein [Botryobacter ruber]